MFSGFIEPLIELWLILALISVLFYAIGIIIDKITLEDIFSDDASWLTAICATSIAPILVITFLRGEMPFMPVPEAFFGLASGVLSVIAFGLYARVIRKNDVDLISALMHMAPLHAALLGLIFFNDHLNTANLFGIICIVAAAILISFPFKKILNKKFGFKAIKNTPFLVIQIICLLGVISGFIADRLVVDHAPLDVLFHYNLGIFICLPFLLVMKNNARNVAGLLKKHGYKLVLIMLIVEFNGSLAEFFIYMAYEKGPFALITTMAAVEPFVVLALAFALCKFAPRFSFVEKAEKSIYERASAFASILMGVHLLLI